MMGKILHIISTLSPESGGPSEVVRVLAGYKPEGSTAEVVTLDDPGAHFLTGIGFPVHAIGPVSSTYGYCDRLIPWLEQNRDRFDGVVVHGLWQYCGYATWRVFGGKVPYAVFAHGMLDPYFKRAFPRKHLKKWIYWIQAEYWILRGAYRVLFTGEVERDLARQSFWLNHWTPGVLPFGTIPPSGDPLAQREVFWRVCPQVRERRFLLFLGRIHPKKGCDLLVNAFAKLAASDPGLHLVMAGPDPANWKAEMKLAVQWAEIEQQVHWPGMLINDAKWGAFYAAEAFVLPSHQENFGIAVVEALACGRPVLISDKVNIAAEIEREGVGLVETDTAEGTERLLLRWMALSAQERAEMGLRATECFRRRYDMRENSKAVMLLFEGAAA